MKKHMEKVSVSIRIPALDNSYDFIVPNNMAVRDVQKLISRILTSEYGVADSMSVLTMIDINDGKALRQECSFSQQGISDGAKLLLL